MSQILDGTGFGLYRVDDKICSIEQFLSLYSFYLNKTFTSFIKDEIIIDEIGVPVDNLKASHNFYDCSLTHTA